MSLIKSKDARKVKEFDIYPYKKGFVADSTIDGITTQEYFQFKEIHQILHYIETGVEIVNFNGKRRVFYNDETGQSLILFDTLNDTMISWMNSNLN